MSLKISWRNKVAYVRGTVRGQNCYETTGTSDPKLAEAYRAKREAELFETAVYGARATVSFQRAALSYLDHEDRSDATKMYVDRLVEHFGAKPLASINQEAADKAVRAIVGPSAAPATKRRGVYAPLLAILNHAAKREWCNFPRFDQPSLPRSKTRWLAPAQAVALIEGAAPHLRPLLRFCLCTGARMAEAIDLDWRDVQMGDRRAIFRDTKNGDDRTAALTPAAIEALLKLPHRRGKVFRRDDGEPYVDRERLEGGQIKRAWRTACRRSGLVRWEAAPGLHNSLEADGPATPAIWKATVTPHDMRHTWATWFYALTRDPMLLRDEGGWKSIKMVERYAHLMPSELVPGIADVWGPSHPRIGNLPARGVNFQEERDVG